MSIAPRETKCLSSCHARSGQSRLGHLVNTEPCGLTVGVSQNGQRSGGRGGGGRSACSTTCGAGETTCGMTSPARSTITSSPGADVLARQVLLVVQRRELDRHAPHRHRLERREGVQVAELADVPHHRVQARHGGRGRELPGDRPARVAPDRAQPALQLEVVDLHDDAVDLEVEPAPALLPAQALRDHLLLVVEQLDVGVDPEPVLAQPLQRLPVGVEATARRRPPPGSPRSTAAAARRSAGSSWRIVPAAELRGFMNVDSPASARRSLSAAKSAATCTPRRAPPAAAARPSTRSGIEPIVRRLWVTSSPISPSPRVAPRSSTPSR